MFLIYPLGAKSNIQTWNSATGKFPVNIQARKTAATTDTWNPKNSWEKQVRVSSWSLSLFITKWSVYSLF